MRISKKLDQSEAPLYQINLSLLNLILYVKITKINI